MTINQKIHGLSIWHPAAIISTVFSIGRIPYMPGTWGSLFGVIIFPLFLLIPLKVSYLTHEHIATVAIFTGASLLILYLFGTIAIRKYQEKTNSQDASEIVYDELFGQIFTYTLIGAFYIYWNMHHNGSALKNYKITEAHSLVYRFIPFLWFRLFDITKPWPIRLIDQKCKNAHGVMLDDVLAAVFAAIASVIVFMIIDSNFQF